MRSKVQERHRAISLRREGKSYKEIQKVVSVSKGTLSKWFSNLPLTKKEEKFLKERSQVLQDKGRLKVALQNRERNEKRRDKIRMNAKIDFERFKKDELFMLGLTLYWAEGAKKNDYFSFINSDPAMTKIMMAWAVKYLPIEPTDFKFRLYIHEVYANENCEKFWSRECTIPWSQFQRTIYKPTPHKVKKNPDYKGCLRMILPGVQNIIVIKTWQECLIKHCLDGL